MWAREQPTVEGAATGGHVVFWKPFADNTARPQDDKSLSNPRLNA
jgi:hypothetical protein